MISFIIAKAILFLLLPPSCIIIIMGFGFVIIRWYPRLGKIFILMGFCILYLLSISPVSNALIKPLESRFSPLIQPDIKKPATIVILGGGVRDISNLGIGPAPSHTSAARLIHGISIYREIPRSVIVISGGSGDTEKIGISEANAMKMVALSLGVPPADIITEDSSRNTFESVMRLKDILKGRNIILVTSASHMKRSAAMFRKARINVTPAPTDYRAEQKEISLFSFIPRADDLEISSTAIYEYMGLLWYQVMGAI